MANLILTNRCNLQCPFCFASENQETKELSQFNLSQIQDLLPYLDSRRTIRLCGGEPTLNRDINSIVRLLLDKGYSIFFMTNGVWSKEFKSFFETLRNEDSSRIAFLFNVLAPGFYTQKIYDVLNETLAIINPINSTLGITIYEERFEYDYIIALANKYQIKKIRISIAAPNLSSGEYHLEKKFQLLGERLIDFINEAQKSNIDIVKDCNYLPPCFFTDEQKLKMKYELRENWDFTCKSSPIDVDNDGNAWRCYGLYSVLNTKISNFKNEVQLRKYFDRRMNIVSNNLYPYEDCKTCDYWQKSCQGGCYTIRMKKALSIDRTINFFPIDDDHDILKCAPIKSKRLVIKEAGDTCTLFHNTTIIEDLDYNTLAFLNEIDGVKTIAELIEMWRSNFDDFDEARTEVVKMCRNLFELDIIDINYDYNINLGYRSVNHE